MEVINSIITTLFSQRIWVYISTASCFSLLFVIVFSFILGFSRIPRFNPRFTTPPPLETYPKISVVMCCKGIHEKSKQNFKQNLNLKYPGPVEFVFVVESEDDPAASCAKEAISEVTFDSELDRETSIIVAGLSYHNAQKIHNMLFGVINCSPDSEYVLFADDDAFLYPGLLEELVTPLVQESDKVLISTGYEFIAPMEGANVFNYCLLIYRLHNLYSFITDRPVLCWGGCWMSPRWIFRQNFAHLVDCYLDGGYSDDTIVSCIVQQEGYVCAHPYQAIFPGVPAKNLKFTKYFDFLTRQFFVNDTYSTAYNKRVVHSIAYLIITSVWLLIGWVAITPIIGLLSIIAYFTSENFQWTTTSTLSTCTVFLWFGVIESINFATKIMTNVANSVRPPEQQISVRLNPIKIFLGLNIHVFLMPFAVIYILLCDSIVWAGVRYYKKDGKIWKVERKDENGEVITELFTSSVSKVLNIPKIKQLLEGSPNTQFDIV